MSYTIRSGNQGFPIPIAGTKNVKTFPSGLVLVSQQYAVPKGLEANYAARFAVGKLLRISSPAVDGLYIFPEPEWRDSGDGFTRITVSAYGRSGLQPKTETSYISGTYELYSAKTTDITIGGVVVSTTTSFVSLGNKPSINGVYTVRKVIASSEPPFLPTPQITTPYVAPYGGNPFIEDGSAILRLARAEITVTNFGVWSEVVDVHVAAAKYYFDPAKGQQSPS